MIKFALNKYIYVAYLKTNINNISISHCGNNLQMSLVNITITVIYYNHDKKF